MRALAVQTMPYRLDEATGLIDYQHLEENAALFRPKLFLAGSSAHVWQGFRILGF